MKTQQDRVLEILKQRRNIGATSQQLRDLTNIVDVPKAISLLREKGYQITDKAEKLGDSTIKRYWIGNQANRPLRYEFDNTTNRAIPVYE